MKTWGKMLVGILASVFVSSGVFAAPALPENFTVLPLVSVGREGTLIFSDSPEYASEYGVLAEGTVAKGAGRVYYYHVNETGKPARLVVYAQAKKAQDISLTRTLRGDPSTDYISTGRTLSFREVTTPTSEIKTVRLPAGERVVLFEENEKGIRSDDLVSGIVEVETETPITMGTALLPMETDVWLARILQDTPYVPADSHGLRGTFPSELLWEAGPWDFSEGAAAIVIGGLPGFQMGYDEIDKKARENFGDYGIAYHLRVKTEGTGRFKLYINPQGGVYVGSFRIGQNEKFLKFYRTETTKRGLRFGHETTEDVMEAGTWDVGQDLFIRFIPAGATYLPIRFLLVKE